VVGLEQPETESAAWRCALFWTSAHEVDNLSCCVQPIGIDGVSSPHGRRWDSNPWASGRRKGVSLPREPLAVAPRFAATRCFLVGYFRDLEERVAPQSQRCGYSTRGRVTLVEA
jgi:hypothetical protein